MVTIAGVVVLGVGVLMVLVGICMNVFDWKPRPRDHPGVQTKRTGLAKVLDAETRFMQELRRHSPGSQMIAWGFLLIIVGGAIAGATYL